jgi:quercetin dioxygenase-like cupin family protein
MPTASRSWSRTSASRAQLLGNTERSVARGTFGSPTFFVGDEIFFGKDRLRDVEEMILTARTRRPANLDVMLKRFEQPDEVRTFEKGKFEIVRIGGMTIGRATYEPGWKWSLHVGPAIGASSCPVEHVGIVVSGRATAAMDNGTIFEMRPGDLFHIAPGHDSWVVGDEPYVSLHFLGVEHYANHS